MHALVPVGRAERDQALPVADPALPLRAADFSQLRIRARAPSRVQPKLVIGSPGDASEREADSVADRVMRSADTGASDAHAHPTRCPRCTEGSNDGETVRRQSISPYSKDDGLVEDDAAGSDTPVQAKALTGSAVQNSPGVAARIQALRTGGAPLPASVRRFMEPRFGHDFGAVRVHAGPMASDTSRRIGARAFTVGRDVVFGHGQFAPASDDGRRLIAHELTHVIQQGHAAAHARAHLDDHRSMPEPLRRAADDGVVRRVAWTPNQPTGRVSHPWGSGGPVGKILKATTDGGTALDIWSPDDGSTYWCHGYTFGGPGARGGPYSIWGSDVPTVLQDDGWKQTSSCMAQPADVLVFWDAQGMLTHSGIIRQVAAQGGRVDDTASTVQSKWGAGSLNTTTWEQNANKYGSYRCYSKAPLTGVCSGNGAHES